MKKKMTGRQLALRKRRIFLSCCLAGLICIIAVIALAASGINKKTGYVPSDSAKTPPSSSEVSTLPSSDAQPENSSAAPIDAVVGSEPKPSSGASVVSEAESTEPKLDPNYSNLLLVNNDNPLPQSYDYEGNLVKIESKYLCGSLNRINAQVYPYLTAMIEAAWKDGVNLKVLSPYRSYATQERLFNNKVSRVIASGTPEERAEAVAATVVARPGTSEHHTGLAVDFNSVEDSFEGTPMYAWLAKNAENYGFILRYTEEKTSKTGVIHESWHWRFVGINEARKINRSGLCLEEYLEKKN